MTAKTRLDRLEKDAAAAVQAARLAARTVHDFDDPATWALIEQVAAQDDEPGREMRAILDAARRRRDAHIKKHGEKDDGNEQKEHSTGIHAA